MTSETERTNQAMDLMGWLLQNRAFLYTAENRYAGETAADFLDVIQEMYHKGFYEACVLYLFMAREQPDLDVAFSETVEELLRFQWKRVGSKQFLEALMEKIRAAEARRERAMEQLR